MRDCGSTPGESGSTGAPRSTTDGEDQFGGEQCSSFTSIVSSAGGNRFDRNGRSRRSFAAAIFAFFMVLSMVAGGVAFGGLAAADNSTGNSESLVDTEPLSADEEGPDANATNGSDSGDTERSISDDNPEEENETAIGVENRTQQTDREENSTSEADSISEGADNESVDNNDSDGRVIKTTSSGNGTTSTSGVADEGTPIDSCTVLGESGRYRLNSSLNAGGLGCIEITTSDVVFDGDGRTITDSSDAVAVQNDIANLSNVTVRDLTISDADTGVFTEFTTTDPTNDLIVRNLTMEGVGTGVDTDSSSDQVSLVDFAVINSTINTTTGPGVAVTGNNDEAYDIELRRNDINTKDGDAVAVAGNDDGTYDVELRRNDITATAGDGIAVTGNNDEAYDIELRRNDINVTAGFRGIDFRIRDDGTAVDLSLAHNDIQADDSDGIHLDLERAEASTNLSLRGNDVTVSEGIGDPPVVVKNNVREVGVNNTIHATVVNNTLTAGGLVDTALRFDLHGSDGSRTLDVRNNTMNRQLDIDANGANTSLGLALTDNVIQSNESDTSTAVSIVTESGLRSRSSNNQPVDLIIERNDVAGELTVGADDDGANANVSVLDNTFTDDNPDSSDGIGLTLVVARDNATKHVDVRRNHFTGENSDLFVRGYGDDSISDIVATNNTIERGDLSFDLQESASPSLYNQTIDVVVSRNNLSGSDDSATSIEISGTSSRTANVSITDNSLTSLGESSATVELSLFGIGLDAETEFRRNTVTNGGAYGLNWGVVGHGATATLAIANNTVAAERWPVYLSGGENQTLDIDLTDNDLTTADPDPFQSDAGVQYSNTEANTSLRFSAINNTINSTKSGIGLDLSEGSGGGAAPIDVAIEENQIQTERDGVRIDDSDSFTPITNRTITVDAVDNVIDSGATGFGIDVENDGGSEIVTVEDNRINASSGAVSLDHVGDRKDVDVAVRDNGITGDRSSGISITADGTSGVLAEPPGTRDVTVADNNLTMTDGGGISLSAEAENLTANVTATDNIVEAGRYSSGITVETDSDGSTVDTNISRNEVNVTDEDGIVIEASGDEMSTAFTVADNVVDAGAESGIILDGGENHTATWAVVDNRIDRPDTGIEIGGVQVLDPSVFDVTVHENEVENGSEIGIDIDPESGTAPPSGAVRVTENNVSSDATAVLIDEGPVAGINISDNRLITDGFGVENRNTTAGTYVNATNNYWNASDGPGSAGAYADPVTGALADGSGATVSNGSEAGTANVHFDPFLQSSTPQVVFVTIESTTAPVTEGEPLSVTVTVENAGDEATTESITLSSGGVERASREVTLDAGESTTETLTWDTAFGDAGNYSVTVASENDSDTRTVVVQSLDSDEIPTAVDDSYTVTAGETLVVNESDGVLTDDTDPAGDELTASLVAGPSNGTITLRANGSFEYTPDTGFTGTDAFTYEATDADGNADSATVTITVDSAASPTPEAPAVETDTVTPSDSGATVNGSLTELGRASSATVYFVYWQPDTPGERYWWTGDSVSSPTAFNATVNLSAGTEYVVKAYARSADGEWVAGEQVEFTTTGTPYQVETSTPMAVGVESATLQGEISGFGTATNATTYFTYWETGSRASTLTWWTGSNQSSPGNFTANVSLEAGTNYTVQALALSADGRWRFGETIQFATHGDRYAIETGTIGNVSTGSAELNGNLTGLGAADNATVYVTYWKEGQKSETRRWWTGSPQDTAGPFTANVSLDAGTTYNYRTWAKDDDGTWTAGSVRNLTTPGSAFAVQTDTPTVTGAGNATLRGTLNGTGDARSATVYLVYWEAGNKTETETWLTGASYSNGTAFAANITELSTNSTYVVRAYAQSSNGVWKAGKTVEFTPDEP